jgi:hypothetical protein
LIEERLGNTLLGMLRALVLILLLTATASASEKPFVRVRWKGSELRITYKDKLMTYDYGDPNDAGHFFLYAIDKAHTDYLDEKDHVVYMILDVQGPSRGPEGAMSQCGAGTEAAKILFALNSAGEVKPPQALLYASCYQNIESDMDDMQPSNQGGVMTIAKPETYLPAPSGHLVTKFLLYQYDADHPQAGMTVTSSCTERDTSDPAAKDKKVPCPK